MKQLGHASQIIPLLHPRGNDNMTEDESASVLEILSRQLSHSDGIRGFFAVYLTSPESLMDEDVPAVLAEAVRDADTQVMVPLACKCFAVLHILHNLISSPTHSIVLCLSRHECYHADCHAICAYRCRA